ncbi:CoA transferase [Chloroflexota bacterium]
MGTLSALYHREHTGKGQRVDISMLDSCLSFMVFNLVHYLSGGGILGREGSRHLSIVPYGVFNTKKGYLALAPSWPRIARVVGADWMIDDPRFQTTELRLKNRDLLEETLQEHLLQSEAEDWIELMKIEDIPAAVVYDESQVVADPQVHHNHMLLNLEHPLGGKVQTIGNPVKMPGLIDEEIYEEAYTAAPVLGQHQDEVIKGILGYSQEKFDQLMAEEKAQREALSESLHKKY